MTIWIFVLALIRETAALSKCVNLTIATCTQCLDTAPECAWCAQPSTKQEIQGKHSLKMRCGTVDELLKSGCPGPDQAENWIVDAPSHREVKSEGDSVLKPYLVDVTLRKDQPISIDLEFTRPSTYPVDMYYVMDLSKSMSNDLENLKKLATDLTDRMLNETKNQFKIGHGSFVDRPVLPFVSELPLQLEDPCLAKGNEPCEPAYTFHNNLPLTEVINDWQTTLNEKVKVSSNLDTPEAGLDAILQATVCDEVNWQKGRFKILIYSSDNGFHVAGDGLVGGLFTPNDMSCHMKEVRRGKLHEYSMAKEMDYPSIGQIDHVLREKGISVVFAVTEPVQTMYSNLADILPQAVVGKLTEDSSNIVELIVDEYQKLSKKVKMLVEDVPSGVDVKIFATCPGEENEFDVRTSEFEGCDNVGTNEKVKFRVEYTWNSTRQAECFDQSVSSSLAVFGMDADTQVNLNFICGCDCGVNEKPGHINCKNGGSFNCGVCECASGFSGDICDCDVTDTSVNFKSMCMKTNDYGGGQLCNGKGKCQCDGTCKCINYGDSRQVTGAYCECDTEVCPKGEDGKPCSGHGKCNCNTRECECDSGWDGIDCGCSTSTDKCIDKNGKSCSGHGRCKCGVCECDEFPSGDFYDGAQCENFQKSCSQHEACALCMSRLFYVDAATDTIVDGTTIMHADEEVSCVDACSSYTDMTETEDGLKLENKDKHITDNRELGYGECEARDEDNCLVTFYIKSDRGRITGESRAKITMVIGERNCNKQNLLIIFLSIFGTILLLGLLILLFIALFKYFWRKREYKKFQESRKDAANFTTAKENPLYKQPESTHNPNEINEREGLLHRSTAQ